MGVFWGVPFGAVVGGIIGAISYVAPVGKKPLTPTKGVGDRDLDD